MFYSKQRNLFYRLAAGVGTATPARSPLGTRWMGVRVDRAGLTTDLSASLITGRATVSGEPLYPNPRNCLAMGSSVSRRELSKRRATERPTDDSQSSLGTFLATVDIDTDVDLDPVDAQRAVRRHDIE